MQCNTPVSPHIGRIDVSVSFKAQVYFEENFRTSMCTHFDDEYQESIEKCDALPRRMKFTFTFYM